jgi:membrane-associated phospholipid phosphatase
MILKKGRTLLLLLCMCFPLLMHGNDYLRSRRIHKRIDPLSTQKTPGYHLGQIFKDILILHKNLVDWDTYKIFVTTFPFVIASGMIDKSIHHCFYCESHHKNLNQVPKFYHFLADATIDVLAGYSLYSYLFSHNEHLRQTSRAFMIGLPFVMWVSDIFKAVFKTEIGWRPWNEQFAKIPKMGFPSTHASQIAYATILFGKQFGIAYALPLGFMTAFIGFSRISGNNHYLSQYVAGIGLGAVYGYAASRLVDSKMRDSIQLTFDNDHKGNPAIKLSYAF